MTEVKITNKKLKAIETKKKIYDTANELFSKYNFEDVSVDAIVKAAGVSKGSFYVHFDSKDSLIAIMTADYINKLDLNYNPFIESFPANTKTSEILLSLSEKIADNMTSVIGYIILKNVYRFQLNRSIDTGGLLDYNRNLYKIFNQIISQGIEQGEFKAEIPVDIIANHCIIAIRGLTYEWCTRYPDFNLKEQVVIHVKMLLTSIMK